MSATRVSRGVKVPRAVLYRTLLDARAVGTRRVPTTGPRAPTSIDRGPAR